MIYVITDSSFGADRIRSQYEFHIHAGLRSLADSTSKEHVDLYCTVLTLDCHTTVRAERPHEWLARHGKRLVRIDRQSHRIEKGE